jgi:GDP-L-fucose synthase
MSEDQLLTGPLEPTNESYAIAKIAGIKLCEAYRRQYDRDFISVMPTNLYGPGDNYHPEHSHVVAALIRRFHEAKINNASTVVIWGTGTPRREFLYVDDFADACVFVLKNYSALQFINIGVGEDIAIEEFARTVAEVVGFHGNITYDASRPDGMPRKLLDVSRLSALGWKARTSLPDGLRKAYGDFLNQCGARAVIAAAARAPTVRTHLKALFLGSITDGQKMIGSARSKIAHDLQVDGRSRQEDTA